MAIKLTNCSDNLGSSWSSQTTGMSRADDWLDTSCDVLGIGSRPLKNEFSEALLESRSDELDAGLWSIERRFSWPATLLSLLSFSVSTPESTDAIAASGFEPKTSQKSCFQLKISPSGLAFCYLQINI